MPEEPISAELSELLDKIADLKIEIRKKALSDGVGALAEDDEGKVVLTREKLESLLSVQQSASWGNHSSGINNAGQHSSG